MVQHGSKRAQNSLEDLAFHSNHGIYVCLPVNAGCDSPTLKKIFIPEIFHQWWLGKIPSPRDKRVHQRLYGHRRDFSLQ